MSQDHVLIVYEIIAFVFAICVHESAHAWTANKCGDPTARMLGRISLNPIKHVDPIGTILVPAIGILSGFGFVGWAKPTPVNPLNLRHQVRDDILVSLAGPASNFLIALVAALGLEAISLAVGTRGIPSTSILVPTVMLLRVFILINILLLAFNLIPVPPLDGSHVIRHMLSDSAQRIYDGVGIFAFLLLFWVGGRVIQIFEMPFFLFFRTVFPGIF
ncbi:MAG: site-2 protease family protein [Terriglobales bacterium]